jgi:predicted nucleic acid-binding protein
MNKVLISNTGPIIALAGVNSLDLLRDLYSQILVPKAVDNEIKSCGHSCIGLQEYMAAQWIEVRDQVTPDPLLMTELDFGEAAVLSLALQEKHSRVLIDERKARKIARMVYGLDVVGTVRVLIDSKHAGLISNVQKLIEKMRTNGYWIHDSIVEYALQLLAE